MMVCFPKGLVGTFGNFFAFFLHNPIILYFCSLVFAFHQVESGVQLTVYVLEMLAKRSERKNDSSITTNN